MSCIPALLGLGNALVYPLNSRGCHLLVAALDVESNVKSLQKSDGSTASAWVLTAITACCPHHYRVNLMYSSSKGAGATYIF